MFYAARTVVRKAMASTKRFKVMQSRSMAMGMLRDPSRKYLPWDPVDLPNRQWPSKTITKAPRWASADLRDGNQALVNPMNIAQKDEFFKLLLKCGFKEIEAGFPSASDTEFQFIRKLIEKDEVPDDVWLQILSPAREELIKKSFEALRDAKKVIFHMYNAAAPVFRDIVFQNTKQQTIDLAVKHVKLVRKLADEAVAQGGRTEWQFEYTPEAFSQTEPEFAIEICQAVKEAWFDGRDKSKMYPIIFNLPATVEVATPNNYADRIEYFCRHIPDREHIVVSLHTHNDRGTGVAASELGLLAGADRVEGCLFGNGERTGNVDLITMALNMYTQGVSPNLDFSEIDAIKETVSRLNDLPVHPRHPWAGELVYTAFSGSHQDAIRKAVLLRREKPSAEWQMPYLPVDPDDIHRTYEAVIRVNSQSGRAGTASLVSRTLQLDMPKRMQGPFYQVVQYIVDETSQEITSLSVEKAFRTTYYLGKGFEGRFQLVDYAVSDIPADSKGVHTKVFKGTITDKGEKVEIEGYGNGPISSLLDALKSRGIDLEVKEYSEHSISGTSPTGGSGSEVRAASYFELKPKDGRKAIWGVGIDEDVTTASLQACISGANQLSSTDEEAHARVKTAVLGK